MISSSELYYQHILLEPDLRLTRTAAAGSYDRKRHEIPFTDDEIAAFQRRDDEAEQRYWQAVDQEKERGL